MPEKTLEERVKDLEEEVVWLQKRLSQLEVPFNTYGPVKTRPTLAPDRFPTGPIYPDPINPHDRNLPPNNVAR